MSFLIIEGDVQIVYDGVDLAVDDATALPAGTRGFISVGYDGTNTRFFRVDSSGHQYVLAKQEGTWTVQAVQSGTWTVQQGTPPWRVEGTDADGSPPTENPVLAAGWDGTNVETLKTNAAGRLQQVLFDDAGNEQIGQRLQAESIPVVFPSDQDPIPITFTPINARTGIASADFGLGGGTAGTVYPMEATTYTEPTAEAQRSFVSTSGNDTAAGTGARTVEFTYFDNTGDGPFTGEVTLAGTTPVDTTETDIRFIEKMRVLTVGSSEANEGTISMYTGTGGGGTVIGSIGYASVIAGRGDNQTLWCHHYIPEGWTGELAVMQCAIQSGGSGTAGRFFIRSQKPLVANSAEIVRAGYLLLPGAFQRSFQFHDTIEGFARLTAYVIPSVNNTEVNCSFDWSEVPA